MRLIPLNVKRSKTEVFPGNVVKPATAQETTHILSNNSDDGDDDKGRGGEGG